MNEPRDTDDTAAFLDRFRPAAPRPDLLQRLLAAHPGLPAVSMKPRIFTFMPRFAAAAAVMVAGGTAVWKFAPRAARETVAGPMLLPAAEVATVSAGAPGESRQQLLGIRDLGIARDTRSRPVRLLHTTWLEDDVSNPGDGTRPVRETRVRDEIVPVLLTTY